MKETIGIYDGFSLARSLFDASHLPNHGDEKISNLMHALCYSIDSAWIDPWRDELDVVVIDVISVIFHLPKSTKFESFQILS